MLMEPFRGNWETINPRHDAGGDTHRNEYGEIWLWLAVGRGEQNLWFAPHILVIVGMTSLANRRIEFFISSCAIPPKLKVVVSVSK